MPKLPRLTFQNQDSARHGAGELLGHDTPEWRHMLPQPEITFEELIFFCLWPDVITEPAVQTWPNSNLPCNEQVCDDKGDRVNTDKLVNN